MSVNGEPSFGVVDLLIGDELAATGVAAHSNVTLSGALSIESFLTNGVLAQGRISANADDAVRWLPSLAVIRDAVPGAGAIGGIAAAIDAADGAVLTVPWDTPFVPASLLRALRETGELHDVDAVVPSSRGAWGVEPLVGWFSPWCAPAIAARLRADDARAGAWLEDVRVMQLESSPWGNADRLFFNINTSQDLAQAQRMMAEAP